VTRHIALLRGINVGGHRRVPMARLREVVAEQGGHDVATYVQSGNVVFSSSERSAAKAGKRLERAIAQAFGFEVDVVMRSCAQLAAIVAANPFAGAAAEPKHLHVLFLAARVAAERVADIDADDHAPAAFRLRGTEIYLWTPGGIGDSRLARALSDRRLGTEATARNWRTVLTLLEMARA
jgi:uncharacterized protein (DUF1697 family)